MSAATLRAAAVAAPFGASVGAAFLAARFFGTPVGAVERTLWWAGVLLASLGALVVFDRAARRLLPLAALLELSLIFPDRAPSRLGVALRSGSTGRLRAREVEALRRGDQEPAEAARTILALAASLRVHDRDTRGHSERVRAYADLIGDELGLLPEDLDRLRWAALLHDLGKLTVPAHTLNASGELTDDDWETLRRHPIEGSRLAEPLHAWLGPWALAIEQHHERFDGTGYPYGLKGDELSLAARIVAVADSYDAMTSPRSYSAPRRAAEARQELAAHAGTHFDPDVVRAFLSVSLGRLRWVMGPLAFLAALPFALPVAGLRRGLETAGRTATLGAVSLAATVSVVQPPVVAPDLAPAPSPVPGRPAAGPPIALHAPAEAPATTAAPAPDAEPVVEERVVEARPAPTTAAPTTAAPTRPVPTAPTPTTAAPTTSAPAAAPRPTLPATQPTAAPVPPTPAVVAATPPNTTTTTAPPCRVVPDGSMRPCQPPRWGHTETGNPAPTTP